MIIWILFVTGVYFLQEKGNSQRAISSILASWAVCPEKNWGRPKKKKTSIIYQLSQVYIYMAHFKTSTVWPKCLIVNKMYGQQQWHNEM